MNPPTPIIANVFKGVVINKVCEPLRSPVVLYELLASICYRLVIFVVSKKVVGNFVEVVFVYYNTVYTVLKTESFKVITLLGEKNTACQRYLEILRYRIILAGGYGSPELR